MIKCYRYYQKQKVVNSTIAFNSDHCRVDVNPSTEKNLCDFFENLSAVFVVFVSHVIHYFLCIMYEKVAFDKRVLKVICERRAVRLPCAGLFVSPRSLRLFGVVLPWNFKQKFSNSVREN
jgi:hypothetical protein